MKCVFVYIGMGLIKRKNKSELSIYDKAFLDKVFTTIGLNHSMNILEISSTPLSSFNAYQSYGCFVDNKAISNVDGIYDMSILYNLDQQSFDTTLSVVREHTDGQIVFISTTALSKDFLQLLNSNSPVHQTISNNYSLFIF